MNRNISFLPSIVLIAAIAFHSCSQSGDPSKHAAVQAPAKDSMHSLNSSIHELSCHYDSLSNQFDIDLSFSRLSDTVTTVTVIQIKDKISRAVLDTLVFTTDLHYGITFENCDSVTSYSTGLNAKRQIVDNYFGDLVIADLNFDGLDDIALIGGQYADAGPKYHFYMQTPNRRFAVDTFLTNAMEFFPAEIDKSKSELTTYSLFSKRIYKLHKSKGSWRLVSREIFDYGEDTSND